LCDVTDLKDEQHLYFVNSHENLNVAEQQEGTYYAVLMACTCASEDTDTGNSFDWQDMGRAIQLGKVSLGKSDGEYHYGSRGGVFGMGAKVDYQSIVLPHHISSIGFYMLPRSHHRN